MSKTSMSGVLVLALFVFCVIAAAQEKPSINVQKQLSQFQINQLDSTRNIVQHVLKINSATAKANSLGVIADAVWELDAPYGRDLFTLSLETIAPRDGDTERDRARKQTVFRKIISLIAKRDPVWAKAIVDLSATQANEGARTNLNVAEDLLNIDEKLAADFANRSLQLDITEGLVAFLKSLRQRNEAEANRLFLNALTRYQQQAVLDATQFGLLGTYLFGSPYINPQDIQSVSYTRVGNVIFPNISTNLPNINPALARAYIGGAVNIISRPTDDSAQRQSRYVLGYLMIPKARQFAPEYVGALSGAMAASVSSPDVAGLQSEDAFKNVNKTQTGSVDDQIDEIEKNPDAYARDQLFLNLAHRTWRAEDFPGSRKATAKIENKEVRTELETLIQFGEAKYVLKSRDDSIAEAIPLVEKLPRSLEKSVLWLAICSKAEKTKQSEIVSYSLDMALKSSSQLSNENAPYILTFISGELANKDTLQSEVVLREAVKEFNKLDRIRAPSLVRNVRLEPLSMPFSLAADGITLDFQSSFQKAIDGKESECDRIVDDLKDENLRGDALAALARSILKKKEPKVKNPPKQGDGVVRVGEDGMRKSAVKTVMPVYPKESLKKKVAGVVVAELQFNGEGDVINVKIIESPDAETGSAVLEALKQWKFKPSQTTDGKPVSIRGKITFYFSIDSKGKGEVKNPKQYQK